MGLDYDSRGQPIPFLTRQQQWQIPFDTQMPQRAAVRRPITPLQTQGHQFQHPMGHEHHQHVYGDWRFQQNPTPLNYAQENAVPYSGAYGVPMQTSPVDLIPATQPALESTLGMNAPFVSMPQALDSVPFSSSWQDVSAELTNYAQGVPDGFAYQQPHSSSPTDTYLEVRSLTSSSSNEGWSAIERVDYSGYVDPNHTLHNRTLSDSSYSDLEQHSQAPFPGHFELVSTAMHSPNSESSAELDYHHSQHRHSIDHGSPPSAAISPVALIRPIPVPIKKSTSPTRSPTNSATSTSPTRKGSRKSPIAKSTEKVIKKPSQNPKVETEKKVGKRKGPLRPDQRKQAGEIRKLRACLRCKFLKKTVCTFILSIPPSNISLV